MPLYEYKCSKCGRFEIIRKFSDAPLTVCPDCGGEVQKLLSAPAIQFKGSGWYITDYARKGAGGDGTAAKDGRSKEDAAKEGASKDAPSKDAPAASKDSSSGTSTETTTKGKPASGGGSTT